MATTAPHRLPMCLCGGKTLPFYSSGIDYMAPDAPWQAFKAVAGTYFDDTLETLVGHNGYWDKYHGNKDMLLEDIWYNNPAVKDNVDIRSLLQSIAVNGAERGIDADSISIISGAFAEALEKMGMMDRAGGSLQKDNDDIRGLLQDVVSAINTLTDKMEHITLRVQDT